MTEDFKDSEVGGYDQDETITFSFKKSSNDIENLKRIQKILKKDKDVKTVEIQYFDHYQNKPFKVKIRNSRLKEGAAPIEKKINKKSRISESNSNGNQKNLHRNAPKILGKAIIDFCYNEKNINTIEGIFQKTLENTIFSPHDLNINRLKEWTQMQRLDSLFNTIQCFKEFWTVEEIPRTSEGVIRKGFRDICMHFLLFEANRLILEKFCGISNKEMKYENALAYLDVLPKLIRGIKEPENFSCLK